MRKLSKLFVLISILVSAFVLSACETESDMDAAIAAVNLQLENSGYEHDETFQLMEKYEDVVITWESTDIVISGDGAVNAIGLTSDIEVKIIVTFTEGDEEVIKNYFVTVYYIPSEDPDDPDDPEDPDDPVDPDQEKIDLVKNYLVLDSSVKEDMVLIEASNGVSISWSSDNDAITPAGIITRSLTEDISVVLTATLTYGDLTDTKTFTVIVAKVEVLAEAKEALELVSSTEEDLILPTEIGEDHVVSISWSSDKDAISSTGVISRSPIEDTTVVLTATLTYNDESVDKEFTVVVVKDPRLDEAFEGLLIDEFVVRDLYLPENIGSVSVSWESSNNDFISTSGEVVKPDSEDVAVTLTATLSLAGHTQTKTFNLVVKPEPDNKLRTPFGFVWQPTYNLIAYAPMPSTGYSGLMQGTFTSPGQETVVYIQESRNGRFELSNILDQLVVGVSYRVELVALGDGIDYADSDAVIMNITLVAEELDDPTNLLITDGVLTWDPVGDADTYEVYSQVGDEEAVLLATLGLVDTLEVTLPTDAGRYVITVVAKGGNKVDSEATIEHLIVADSLIVLDAPVISYEESTKVITWLAIENAIRYEITIGDVTISTTELSDDLSDFTLDIGTYSVTVVALGDSVIYGDSAESNVVEYVKELPSAKVDATGLLIQRNVSGHYSIERPASVNPDGWNFGKYIVQIYSGDDMVAEGEYESSSAVIHFQTPSEGLLDGLEAGDYTVHFIMVGNMTTHVNSDPVIYTLTLED